ncbi:hypothetical protein F5141DRAFT_1061989 [Pisolithus sp. B1]|nr:hypothetical protein F5141DRAFT_1061989 [Pisolithus sp. B1]
MANNFLEPSFALRVQNIEVPCIPGRSVGTMVRGERTTLGGVLVDTKVGTEGTQVHVARGRVEKFVAHFLIYQLAYAVRIACNNRDLSQLDNKDGGRIGGVSDTLRSDLVVFGEREWVGQEGVESPILYLRHWCAAKSEEFVAFAGVLGWLELEEVNGGASSTANAGYSGNYRWPPIPTNYGGAQTQCLQAGEVTRNTIPSASNFRPPLGQGAMYRILCDAVFDARNGAVQSKIMGAQTFISGVEEGGARY